MFFFQKKTKKKPKKYQKKPKKNQKPNTVIKISYINGPCSVHRRSGLEHQLSLAGIRGRRNRWAAAGLAAGRLGRRARAGAGVPAVIFVTVA